MSADELSHEIETWNFWKVYGAFCKESGKLVGYALINRDNICLHYSVHKVIPRFEPLAVNAALVNGVLEDINLLLKKGCYLCDGERNILHETGFQNYLEKYFGFRKAFCTLNILYKKEIGVLVKVIFPLRRLFIKLDSIKLVHQLNGVLLMEEIEREQRCK